MAASRRVHKLITAGLIVSLLLSMGFWVLLAGTESPASDLFGILGFLFSVAVVALSVFWWGKREHIKGLEVELTKLKDRQRRANINNNPSISSMLESQLAYRDNIPNLIAEYRKRAAYYRRIHSWLQSVVIIGSIAASSITSLAIAVEQVQWIAAVVTFAVGVAAGFIGYFKFRERSMYLRQTADAIEYEWQAAELRIRHYRGLKTSKALAHLIETVEAMREEQRKREQQLEQPADESHRTVAPETTGGGVQGAGTVD